MEPTESNLKPQPTGGLKLMTVFIAVLALHVVVIGGFTVWHLLNPSSTDSADLTMDKTHKNKIGADSSIADMPGDTGTDKAVTPATTSGATLDSAVSGETTADAANTSTTPTTVADTSAATPDASTSSPASSNDTTAAITPTPATTMTTSTPPTMAEDASSAAANPPVKSTEPMASSAAPMQHPAVAMTSADLTPPADSTTGATADAGTTPAVDGASYTVKRGDSLARIARHHHLTVEALRTANNLKSDRLHIAQVLVLPSRTPKAAPADADAEALATPAPATSGPVTTADLDTVDTTPAVAAPIHVTHKLASSLTPHHTHKLTATATHHLYTVVRGDTLTKIAKRYHTTTSALVAANGLSHAGRLSIGQKLHIPSHESRTADEKPIDIEPHRANRAQLANNLP